MAVFTVENLSFTYPEAAKPALREVSFSIEPGEFVVICGKSGCGKSTLLRHFKTVLSPYGTRQGSVLYEGRPLEQVSEREQAGEIGYVLQNPDNQLVTDKSGMSWPSAWKIWAMTGKPSGCGWQRWPAFSGFTTGSTKMWRNSPAARSSC